MPHKLNAERRHHIPKMQFKVTNWAEYEAGLRRRGSLTLWITPEAIDGWGAERRTTRGGPATYSDSAIQTCLMLRSAFKMALRQTEGLMASIIELLGCELAVPDHTTVSRRAIKLPSIDRARLPEGPLHVLIDSTGLKVYGAGEWLADKHGRRAPRQYRKLHLAVDADSGEIVAVTLTVQDVDDPSQVAPLLEQIPNEIEQVTGDGAYDGEPTYAIIAARSADIAVVIPPRATSAASPDLGLDASRRDVHVHTVAALGRLAWQEVTGYGRRALVETTMGRYKALIGDRLRARTDGGRRTEAAVGAAVLNRMLAAGRPNSVRTARTTN
jgi:Transposase DDE domain